MVLWMLHVSSVLIHTVTVGTLNISHFALESIRHAADMLLFGPGDSILSILLGTAMSSGRSRTSRDRWIVGLFAAPTSVVVLRRRLVVLSSVMADHSSGILNNASMYCLNQLISRSHDKWSRLSLVSDAFWSMWSWLLCQSSRLGVPILSPCYACCIGLYAAAHCSFRGARRIFVLLCCVSGWARRKLLKLEVEVLQWHACRVFGEDSYKTKRAIACHRHATAKTSWIRSIIFFCIAMVSASLSGASPPPPTTGVTAPSSVPCPQSSSTGALTSVEVDRLSFPAGSTIEPSPLPLISRDELKEMALKAMTTAAKKFGFDDKQTEQYLSSARVLVIEVAHDTVWNIVNYRRIAGVMGGLHEGKRPYLKRIVLAVDGPEGLYGAADLNKNLHYQISPYELDEFYDDLVRLELPLHNAADPFPETNCSVLCLPDSSHLLENEYFSLGSSDFCNPSCQSLVRKLGPSRIFSFLSQLSADSFDSERGNLCINYGWLAMDATERREDLCGSYAPKLSKAVGKGWLSSSRGADSSAAMATMTALTDYATKLHGMEPLFGSKNDSRAIQYAVKIHPENRAESITFSLSAMGEDKFLLAHLDHLNDFESGYQWNVSYYGYHQAPKSSCLRRMHIGIYSRRVCGTTSSRCGRALELYDDLVSFLDALPRVQVEYSPKSVMDGVDKWEDEARTVSTSQKKLGRGARKRRQRLSKEQVGRRRVHINKFVL